MTFADDLRAWREAQDISQDLAAALLGLPLATYRNYEQGRKRPAHERTVRLAMVEAERRRRKHQPAHA